MQRGRVRVVRTLAHDDDALLDACRAGSEVALAELYRRHRRDALRYAERLRWGDDHATTADDVLAEAMRKVLSAMSRGYGPTTGFRPYLFAAVRSVCARLRANGGHEEPTDQLPDEALPGADDVVEAMVASAALATLPARWQEVLVATVIDERPLSEVAPACGMRANSVAALSARARTALRIAYTRAHLPNSELTPCQAALDALARRTITCLAPRPQRALEEHLASCPSCERAAEDLSAEIGSWRWATHEH
jgi:RNA polymerase sigma factor (sigma-70 family)